MNDRRWEGVTAEAALRTASVRIRVSPSVTSVLPELSCGGSEGPCPSLASLPTGRGAFNILANVTVSSDTVNTDVSRRWFVE